MNKIMLVAFPVALSAALLGAAGCSKKSSDCSAAIAQGIDRYLAAAKQAAAGSPRLAAIPKIQDQLKTAMTQRCNDDHWQAEAVSCFGKVASAGDMKACEDKLSRDQRTKLDTDLLPIMMGGMGATGSQMPPLAGHPAALTGNVPASGSAGDAAGSAATGSAAEPAPPSTTTPTPTQPSGPATPAPGGW
ncbi:MAG TPA: hypothetical protein VGD37_33850 [Kofleriaceae bacterium]|jgi:hypothetical protein